MEHQQPRRHRRRLLTPPRRDAPRQGCVRRLLRFAARHVIQLTQACCNRPRHAPAPTQEPRTLTSEETMMEKRRVDEQIAREISEDSMSRYSWNRITYNRIPSLSRLATSSSSSDSWLQPRYSPGPPTPSPRRHKTQPLKRTAAISRDDIEDAAVPSCDESANPDTSTADQDIDASAVLTAVHDSPESQTNDSAAATSKGMPRSLPCSEMSITDVQDMAHSDLGGSGSSIIIANLTECQTTPSGTSETVSQRPPQKPPRKSRIKSMDTAVLSPVTPRKEQAQTDIDTNAPEAAHSSSKVPTQPTTSLLIDTVPLINVARTTCASSVSGEQDLNAGENCEASTQVFIKKEEYSTGTMTYTSQALSKLTTVSTQSSLPLLVEASTQIMILDHKEMPTVMPTVQLSNHDVQDDMVANAQNIVSSSLNVPPKPTASLLFDTNPVPYVEISACPSSISGEEQKLNGTENREVAMQASVTKEHSVGTMAYTSQALPGFTTVSTQSPTPLLVDTCKQIVLEPEDMLPLMPTVELSQRIVNLVQNNIIIPTKGQSTPSDTAWIENRVQQLLRDVLHLAPDLTPPPIGEAQKVQLKGNDDQHKGNISNRYDDVSQELLAAMTDVDSNSSDDSFVDSSAVLSDFPIQETMSSSEFEMSSFVVIDIDEIDTEVIIDKGAGNVMCDNTAKWSVDTTIKVKEQEKSGTDNKDEFNLPETNAECTNAGIAVGFEHLSVPKQSKVTEVENVPIQCEPDPKEPNRVKEHSPVQKSCQENNMENCLTDKYQATSSDEEDSSHKTSREIFGYVNVSHKRLNSLLEDKTSDEDSVQPGCSSQPDTTVGENCLMDSISVTSSDEETLHISTKTSQETFCNVNIDGSKEKKMSQTSTHTNQLGSKQPKPQNRMQRKELFDPIHQADVEISRKASRERFGHVNTDASNDKSVSKGKGQKSSKDSRSCQKSPEWEKCLKELREALCSDPRDYEKTRKTSRERFGHVNIDCTSNEKTQRNGMNDPNKGVHHHHSDISCDEAGSSQPQEGPPDKSTGGKSVKFVEDFESPRTPHYGLIDRETYPLKSVLKRTVRDSPETDNVVHNNTSVSPVESSARKQTSAPESPSFSDIPGTSSEKDSQLPPVTNDQPQEHPNLIMGHDGFAYPSVIVPILSGEEVEFYEEEDTSVQVMLGIGSHGYCQAAKYTCPNGSVLPVAVKLCFNTDNQPALMREGRMSQYLRNIGVFPEFHGYLYLNLDSRLVVGLVSELFGGGKTLYGLLKYHHLLLAGRGWVEICIQLAKGLQKIHGSQVIYNGLKSKNILVDVKNPSHPVIKFIDLGLATYKYGVVQYYEPEDVHDVEHIAPELKGTHSSSKYSDIWALGALYLEIYNRTQAQGLNDVSKSALVTFPWCRPSLETIIKSLEGVANKLL